MKVAVVDDGVDQEHEFLDPTGFSFPPGFPKGPSGGTSPKVIVARGFAGPGQTEHRSIATSPSTGRSSQESSPACRRTFQPVGAVSATKRRADVIRPSPACRASHHVRTSGTIASSTSPARSAVSRSANSPEIVAAFEAAGARRDGHHQLLRAVALRPIPGRTCSSKRSRMWFAPASYRSSRRATTATTSGSELQDRPRPLPMRSASVRSRTRMSSALRCRSSLQAAFHGCPSPRRTRSHLPGHRRISGWSTSGRSPV